MDDGSAVAWGLSDFSRAHATFDEAGFLAQWDCPFLVVRWPEPGGAGEQGSFETLKDMTVDKVMALARAAEQVFPLRRRGVHEFDFVTLGRTSNNDLVVDSERVSKCHMIFRERGGNWQLTDTGSTNGTRVDGQPLEPRRPVPLTDDTTIEIGQVMTATFLTASEFYSRHVAGQV